MYYAQITKNRIRELCKKKKITQEEMLAACGLGDNAIRQINDTKGMASFSLARIADHLDCSVDYLLGRTDTVNVAREPQSPDECKLLERYRSLSEDDRITALGDLIRFASEKAAIKSEAPEDAEAPSGADLVTHWDLLGKR